jgi:hypothetical protein
MSHPGFPSLPNSPPCPFCSGVETELINPFGGQLSVAQYWCRSCRSGFDFLKWTGGRASGGDWNRA